MVEEEARSSTTRARGSVYLSTLYEMTRVPLYYLVGGVLLVWLSGCSQYWCRRFGLTLRADQGRNNGAWRSLRRGLRMQLPLESSSIPVIPD
jgi:hypothetical protein